MKKVFIHLFIYLFWGVVFVYVLSDKLLENCLCLQEINKNQNHPRVFGKVYMCWFDI